MNEVTLIGIDLGKHVFHLHAQHAKGMMCSASASRACNCFRYSVIPI
ncbi:hypothetical protein [Caballeronia grimmiae]